uniref:Antifreeze protein n=1 Tax=Glaciozyma antarctica TaxID=105987 RepID=M1KFZ9_9BASI|nr:antifreeze protein [Glaciozyma antarctica]
MISLNHSGPMFFFLLSSLASLVSAATAIELGAASQYALLGRFGTTVGALVEINGDIAVSPSLSTTLVGFALVPADGHATSVLVNGRIYAPDYASSPAALDQAALNVLAAWKSAMDQPVPPSDESKRNLGAGVLSGMTLTPGVYNFGSAITWSTDITLVGGVDDVFLFQANGAISCAASVKVIISGGVQAKNVGIAISNAAVTVGVSSIVNGRFYAEGAMTIGAGVVVTGPIVVAPIDDARIPAPPVSSASLLPTATDEIIAECTASTITLQETFTVQAPVETVFVELPASAGTVTSSSTETVTSELAAATVTVEGFVSTETVTRPVSTVIQFATVTWNQRVVQTVTSTVVWRVFTAAICAEHSQE